jgi:tRNAThr (cytosine32-N3)-methyltransferase
MTDPVARSRALIDAAHAADPDGRELAYADAVERQVLALVPGASPVLRLAARAQHLERWTLPRSAYPMDRPGYHAWRTEQYRRMGARAKELCLLGGLPTADAERVELLVAKRLLKEPDGQAVEDAACIVFLESEIAGFAASHGDYTPEKYIDILRKTMRKMSQQGRERALALPLPEPIAGLVRAAAASLRNGSAP